MTLSDTHTHTRTQQGAHHVLSTLSSRLLAPLSNNVLNVFLKKKKNSNLPHPVIWIAPFLVWLTALSGDYTPLAPPVEVWLRLRLVGRLLHAHGGPTGRS